MEWNLNEFCRGWLVTGATGSGKTACGINQLMHQVFKNCNGDQTQFPRWGGVCIDDKGVYADILKRIAENYNRLDDLVVLEAGHKGSPLNSPKFNLIEDASIPSTTYAATLIQTAETVSGGTEDKGFFRSQAEAHMARTIEFLRQVKAAQIVQGIKEAAQCRVALDMVLELLSSKSYYDAFLKTNGLIRVNHQKMADGKPVEDGYVLQRFQNAAGELVNEPHTEPTLVSPVLSKLMNEFTALLWSQPADQLGGVQGTIHNYLAHFSGEAVKETFCGKSTFKFADIDQGKIICVKMPQSLQVERRSVCAFLKFLFYGHALRRFDLPSEERKTQNLIILWQDEAQRFVNEVDSNVDVIREARATTVMACQSQTSLGPPLGNNDKRDVLLLNIRNRLIFRAADEDCAESSSGYLGQKLTMKKSFTHSNGGRSINTSMEQGPIVKGSEFRALKDFYAYVCSADGKFRKYVIEPLESNGRPPHWWNGRLLRISPLKWMKKHLFLKTRFI